MLWRSRMYKSNPHINIVASRKGIYVARGLSTWSLCDKTFCTKAIASNLYINILVQLDSHLSEDALVASTKKDDEELRDVMIMNYRGVWTAQLTQKMLEYARAQSDENVYKIILDRGNRDVIFSTFNQVITWQWHEHITLYLQSQVHFLILWI